MPLYEYECEGCGHRFEVIQKFSDALVERCPSCGGTVRKLVSSPAIQFKGTGWYITDYPKKDAVKAGNAENTSADAGKDKADRADRAEKPSARSTPAAEGGASSPSTPPSTSASSDKPSSKASETADKPSAEKS